MAKKHEGEKNGADVNENQRTLNKEIGHYATLAASMRQRWSQEEFQRSRAQLYGQVENF